MLAKIGASRRESGRFRERPQWCQDQDDASGYGSMAHVGWGWDAGCRSVTWGAGEGWDWRAADRSWDFDPVTLWNRPRLSAVVWGCRGGGCPVSSPMCVACLGPLEGCWFNRRLFRDSYNIHMFGDAGLFKGYCGKMGRLIWASQISFVYPSAWDASGDCLEILIWRDEKTCVGTAVLNLIKSLASFAVVITRILVWNCGKFDWVYPLYRASDKDLTHGKKYFSFSRKSSWYKTW